MPPEVDCILGHKRRVHRIFLLRRTVHQAHDPGQGVPSLDGRSVEIPSIVESVERSKSVVDECRLVVGVIWEAIPCLGNEVCMFNLSVWGLHGYRKAYRGGVEVNATRSPYVNGHRTSLAPVKAERRLLDSPPAPRVKGAPVLLAFGSVVFRAASWKR